MVPSPIIIKRVIEALVVLIIATLSLIAWLLTKAA
jgi:hypothetical protein